MYKVSLFLTRLSGGLLVLLAALFTGHAYAGNWNNGGVFQYSNDFSKRIYHDGASWNETGPHTKAARIVDEELSITLTPQMLDNDSNKRGRFELEKDDIQKNLAVYQSFKFKSDKNKILDRVLISQIKFRKRNSGGISPIAAVYLDRAPACYTWVKLTDIVDINERPKHGMSLTSYHLEQEIFGNKVQYQWRASGGANRAWGGLNDGNWHTVEMDVYPHPSDGYCIIKIDGKIWNAIIGGPTKSYFGGRHGDYAARIGIYRDAVNYNHTVTFDDWQVKAYKPEAGPVLELE